MLGGKTRRHAVPAVVVEDAGQHSAVGRPDLSPGDRVGLHQVLHLIEGGPVDDRLVLAGKPFALVTHLTQVGSALEEIGKGSITPACRC